ncbi:sensor histidine kinase [Flavobacterium agrisoli]|uniref:histidine kinase n=1 Tax=Flavobacterium agrisoli TaxID=2793066 RepID=A0A934PJJ6_9FLAO|nr:HAMP domain-containing sensor histidine kinase [Flavobacterium agrisoli]MBK0369311.1 HAMP domain-containing histidine kinase [Flavobacterium agrisoli]
MKIRNRLTLLSSVTFSLVFITAAIIIYVAFYQSSQKRIFDNLQRICLLSAIYYLEKDELPITEHIQIREQYNENIQDVLVGIYNENNQVQYGSHLSFNSITPQILKQVRKDKKIKFESKNHFYFGIFYQDNQGDFVVFVQANDQEFKTQNHQLMVIMAVVLLLGLLVIYLLSFFLSKVAYKPVHDIVKQVNAIEASSLDQTMVNLNTKDELQYLTESYNNLLQRLANTFKMQKNFINYVSHEFKTPLASITGHLEVFGQKERSSAEYHETSQKVLQNVQEIEEILNTLLLVSGLKTETGQKEIFRVDELIWDITDKLANNNQLEAGRLKVVFDIKQESKLTVKGNESEIAIAVYNIVENAIKYSEKSIEIQLLLDQEKVQLKITDSGRGINNEDLEHIKETFFRGSNVGKVQGTGLGLSLAAILLAKNNIDFKITSVENEGTTVTLTFAKL